MLAIQCNVFIVTMKYIGQCFVLMKQVEIMFIYNLFNKLVENIKGKYVVKLSCIVSVFSPACFS